MKDIELPMPFGYMGKTQVFTAAQVQRIVEADRAQRVPDGYSEDQIAQAAMEAEIPDSKLESLLIALASTPAQPAQPVERKPMTSAQRERLFIDAERAMAQDINLSWRHALVEAVERHHGIKE